MAGNFYMGSPSAGPQNPLRPGNEGTNSGVSQAPAPPSNVLPGQGIRPTGPSQGFDPSYLQNLATYVGGLFANPGQSSTLNFNPLGNLSEISPSSGMLGNAPNPGQPLTWLQQALNGLPFSFGGTSQAATTQGGTQGTSVAPKNPVLGPTDPRLVRGL